MRRGRGNNVIWNETFEWELDGEGDDGLSFIRCTFLYFSSPFFVLSI
jgi:hypothetical protein